MTVAAIAMLAVLFLAVSGFQSIAADIEAEDARAEHESIARLERSATRIARER